MSDFSSKADLPPAPAGLQIELEWGDQGILALPPAALYVIVDVLSFSTCVDIALGRGSRILPYRFRDASAAAYAASRQALLARDRGQPGFSLSPASLQALPAGTRLVLPSPNGATLSQLPGQLPGQLPQSPNQASPLVLCACLRNAAAVAAWIRRQDFGTIRLIPAGERWPDGSLRPALEDWLGAGAVLAELRGSFGPEARLARESFLASQADLPALIRASPSGQELLQRGFGADLELALELNQSQTVPGLAEGSYADWATGGAASGTQTGMNTGS